MAVDDGPLKLVCTDSKMLIFQTATCPISNDLEEA